MQNLKDASLSSEEEIPSQKTHLSEQPRSIALAGIPNSGKTSAFNCLTGSRYKVGNYPGVTVEKRVGRFALTSEYQARLIDCPGIYCLGEFSEDETVTTQLLLGRSRDELQPDVILYTLDASNLEKSLFLLSQLLDLGTPIIVLLTMQEVAKKAGRVVYPEILQRQLQVPVISFERGSPSEIHQLRRALGTGRFSVSSKHERPLSKPVESAASALGLLYASETSLGTRTPARALGMGILSGAIKAPPGIVSETLSILLSQLTSAGIDPTQDDFSARHAWVHHLLAKCSRIIGEPSSLHNRLDALLTHRVWGLIIFTSIMAGLFQAVFFGAELPMQLIESSVTWLSTNVETILSPGPLRSLLVDGIIAGVGNVIIFLPQIAILFLLLGILEESGYLARAAYVMDRVLRPFGLQGRSFVPLLSSFACAVPGILSARTISSRADRFSTIMVAPLMSCSARLPVYTILIAAFIPEQATVLGLSLQGLTFLGLYVLGIATALCVSTILRTTFLRGTPSLFLMELPRLRRPRLAQLLRTVRDQSSAFLRAAGTMILACSVLLWFLASYPAPPELGVDESALEYSYAGTLGKLIEPVIKPLGFDWKIGVSILASFAAREVFVSSMATIHNLDPENEEVSLTSAIKRKYEQGTYPLGTGLSLLVFYAFACQCMSTLAVVKKETGSYAWTCGMFLYMTLLAYAAAFLTFQIFS